MIERRASNQGACFHSVNGVIVACCGCRATDFDFIQEKRSDVSDEKSSPAGLISYVAVTGGTLQKMGRKEPSCSKKNVLNGTSTRREESHCSKRRKVEKVSIRGKAVRVTQGKFVALVPVILAQNAISSEISYFAYWRSNIC
jgi:hypothetical protein